MQHGGYINSYKDLKHSPKPGLSPQPMNWSPTWERLGCILAQGLRGGEVVSTLDLAGFLLQATQAAPSQQLSAVAGSPWSMCPLSQSRTPEATVEYPRMGSGPLKPGTSASYLSFPTSPSITTTTITFHH